MLRTQFGQSTRDGHAFEPLVHAALPLGPVARVTLIRVNVAQQRPGAAALGAQPARTFAGFWAQPNPRERLLCQDLGPAQPTRTIPTCPAPAAGHALHPGRGRWAQLCAQAGAASHPRTGRWVQVCAPAWAGGYSFAPRHGQVGTTLHPGTRRWVQLCAPSRAGGHSFASRQG